jgi:pSer/pThr/pTyr-binding forkhead associated (FHA) protein
MSSIIIQEAGKPDRIFRITQKEIIIGRGAEADIALPHITVSREHAKIIHLTEDDVFIENVNTQDNMLINGEEKIRSQLKTKDRIQIGGKYTLIFFSSKLTPMEQFFEGKALDEYPPYNRTSTSNRRDATFQMSASKVRKMMDSNNVIRNAIVKLGSDLKQTWRPKDKDLTFGKEGKIPVDGWFTGGIAATICWNGNDHILKGKSGFFAATLTVNGQKISGKEKLLNDGDKIQVGNTLFIYELNIPDEE